jgi:hypothetical protein
MHKCQTWAMKKKYTDLSLRYWREIGETKMAQVFEKSYVASAEHSCFRYNKNRRPFIQRVHYVPREGTGPDPGTQSQSIST